MATPSGQSVKQDIEKRYLQRTAKTREHLETAKKYLPGGDTRSAAYYGPYPVLLVVGAAIWLTRSTIPRINPDCRRLRAGLQE
jgi:hypothetical protein